MNKVIVTTTGATGGQHVHDFTSYTQTGITEILRDAPSEVDACQVLGGGDGVSEHWTVSWEKLDNVWGQTALPQDFVDGVAGRDSGVTGLPQDDVPLKNTSSSTELPQLSADSTSSLLNPLRPVNQD